VRGEVSWFDLAVIAVAWLLIWWVGENLKF
jgi:hypothetical protein